MSLQKAVRCVLAPAVTPVWAFSAVGGVALSLCLLYYKRGWVTSGSIPSSNLLPSRALLGRAAAIPGLDHGITPAKRTDRPPSPSLTCLGDDEGWRQPGGDSVSLEAAPGTTSFHARSKFWG